jgi:hypothetical protein
MGQPLIPNVQKVHVPKYTTLTEEFCLPFQKPKPNKRAKQNKKDEAYHYQFED